MIPRRISLRGFLCYREEQEVDFSGSTVWMLAGLNGSGKSAVFDAVTYALFGYHRGGSQRVTELINKDADGLQVEFDFLLDGGLYRARKTVRKSNRGSPSATQQIFQFNDAGRWEPVGDTNRKTEYDRWVRDHLGLTFETFTSSVLLLQGRAEKLLDSAAKGRFEVLAGIVDLERYARLHARADDRRRELKAEVGTFQNQVASIPEVTPEELSSAEAKVATATTGLGTARAEFDRRREAESQARRWAELGTRSEGLAARWKKAQAMIAGADAIERDAARLADLAAVVPHLETALKQRGQMAESQRQSDALEARRKATRERLSASAHALDQAQQKRGALQKAITSDEQRQRELQAKLRRLEGLRAQISILEQQRWHLERGEADLARLPADVERRLAAAEEEHTAAARAVAVVPSLTRLARARDELLTALDRERRAAEQERSIKARGEQLANLLSELAPRLEARCAERKRADDEASAAAALLKQAGTEEKEFRRLEGARVCRQCGQDLTPAHFVGELAKRQKEVAYAESRMDSANGVQKSAQTAEAALRHEVAVLEKERQEKREEFRDVRRQVEQGRADVERLSGDCFAAYQELPEPYRSRVAATPPDDWCKAGGPTPGDLDAVRADASKLAAAERAVRALRGQHVEWTGLNRQVESLRQSVATIAASLPGKPEDLHRDFARAESDELAVSASLKAAKAERQVVENEVDRLTGERQTLEGDVWAVDHELQLEEAKRHHSRQTLAAAAAAMPETWREVAGRAKLTDLHAWKTERDGLAALNVEGQVIELRQVRAGLDSLRDAMADLDRELDSFPVEARRPTDEVREALANASRGRDVAEEVLRQARQLRATLDDRRQRRAELQASSLDAERRLKHQDLLTELLSRDRLQLYLVRRAERQIVDHANAVLDRLSGGQLYLRLRPGAEGDEPDKALDLEAYNRVTGGSAIGVAFLSGSQRFRVAVSLALGIGQYASRQHRPIESVIIDEGFGCLDRNGRQVMIQELQNLRSHLKCILLVSHQEEFAEAFNDGYRFELTDGTTRVTRIRR
jgi:DNA repair exonuclease SbcCD ATPase subunit